MAPISLQQINIGTLNQINVGACSNAQLANALLAYLGSGSQCARLNLGLGSGPVSCGSAAPSTQTSSNQVCQGAAQLSALVSQLGDQLPAQLQGALQNVVNAVRSGTTDPNALKPLV